MVWGVTELGVLQGKHTVRSVLSRAAWVLVESAEEIFISKTL